jgi:type I restriction enzyme S subunit
MQHTPTLFSERTSDDYSASQKDRNDFKKVKQVGWIPEDWTTARIAELGEVVTGTTPKTKKTHYYDGPYPFVSPGDMGEEMFVNGTEKTLTEAGFETARPVPAGSVLFVCIGSSIGKVAIATEPVATNQQINAVVPRDSIESKYLYYMLDYHAERIHVLAGVQAVPSINKTTFQNESIPVAPARERAGIVDHLDTWDRAIEQTAALIDRKQTRLHGLRQRLMTGEKRFPDCIGSSGMKEVDIGEVPKDWSQQRLGDLFSWKTDKNEDDEIDKVITVGKDEICDQEEHFNRSVASDDLSNYRIIEPGDFVYDPMSAYYGALGRYDLEETGVVSPAYRVLELNDGYDSDFVKFLLESYYVQFRINASSLQNNKSGKRRGLKQDAFASIQVHIPPQEEQFRIAETLSVAEAEINQLKQKRDALKQQKKGLMQRLLTGKVRTI